MPDLLAAGSSGSLQYQLGKPPATCASISDAVGKVGDLIVLALKAASFPVRNRRRRRPRLLRCSWDRPGFHNRLLLFSLCVLLLIHLIPISLPPPPSLSASSACVVSSLEMRSWPVAWSEGIEEQCSGGLCVRSATQADLSDTACRHGFFFHYPLRLPHRPKAS